MSTYEKIISVLLALLLVFIVFISYRELREQPERQSGASTGPNFEASIGQNFIIGSFANVISEDSSGGVEDNCEALKPVIVGALHDVKERLEHAKPYTGVEDAFEVNEQTLQLLCNKNADITLADAGGNKLILQKAPFTKVVPPQSTTADIGTEVRINATIAPAGKPVPTEPTTYGDVLIPDRYLDAATSSAL
jgi:hypothetical protein